MMLDLSRLLALVAIAAMIAAPSAAPAQDGVKPKPSAEREADGEVARYCGAVAPSAAEARLEYQFRRLTELEARLKDEVAALEKREAEARDWVDKRQELLKAASDDVVAIYAKMSADAAATQLAAMDETIASSVLVKLKPQAASAILNEMEAAKAARLTTLMAGGPVEDKKS
ncbi:MAG: MotE family protein [Roseiarcus sp.]